LLLDMRGLDRLISFDVEHGVIRCEAGVMLGDILDLTVPAGWFLPVSPGTKFVTVGGAIANDVHGKNHHCAGSFGCHVRQLELLRSDGSRRRCSRTENPEWFGATIAGLGLTGVILWAEIQLHRVAGAAMGHRDDTVRRPGRVLSPDRRIGRQLQLHGGMDRLCVAGKVARSRCVYAWQSREP
jgi:FAD/FMN-containing dehydrogenase